MPTLNEKKSSVLYVHEILKNYSDEFHKLTYRDIADKLQLLYGIEIERTKGFGYIIYNLVFFNVYHKNFSLMETTNANY